MDHERIAGTGANELLHRVAIERACRRGCERYDMQRSPSPNVARFKAKFGAQLQDFLEYRFENARLSAVEQRARAAAKRALRAGITATRR
jgi:lipid II:glycine glycyltransferase (peptidoglycan interpeptide bridge formation enzyme)